MSIFHLMYCVEMLSFCHITTFFTAEKQCFLMITLHGQYTWPISSCSFSFISKHDTCIFSVCRNVF